MRQWLRTVIGLACATGALGVTVHGQTVDVRGAHGIEVVTETMSARDMGTRTSLLESPRVKEDYAGRRTYAYGQDLQGYGTDTGLAVSSNAVGYDETEGDSANKGTDAQDKDKAKSESKDKDMTSSKDKAKTADTSKDEDKSEDKDDDDNGATSSKKKSRYLPADQKKIDAAVESFNQLAGIKKPVDKVKDFDGFPAVKGYTWIKVEDMRRDELKYLKEEALEGNSVPHIDSLESMQEVSPLTYLKNSSFQEPDMDITGLMYGSLDNALNIYGKDSKVISQHGPYTVYDFPGGTFTSYRPELPNGTFEAPFITSVHVVNHSFAMGHGVRVGSTRSQVLFAYGAPNAMYRRAKNSDEILYLYASPRLLTMGYRLVPEKGGVRVEDLDLKAVGGYAKKVPMSVLTPKYDGPLVQPTTEAGYLVFTFKKDRVESIDSFRAQSFPWKSFPRLVLRQYPLGYVSAGDFRLMGHTVGDTFRGEPDVSWLSRGTYSGDGKQEAITYKDLVFVYNDKRKVSRIFVSRSFNAMTPRGVTIGDSRNLMLFLYGIPSYPAYESEDGQDVMYVYMEPNHYSKYLVFTVNKKTGFISDIELTSEAPKKVIALQNKQGKVKEDFMDILKGSKDSLKDTPKKEIEDSSNKGGEDKSKEVEKDRSKEPAKDKSNDESMVPSKE